MSSADPAKPTVLADAQTFHNAVLWLHTFWTMALRHERERRESVRRGLASMPQRREEGANVAMYEKRRDEAWQGVRQAALRLSAAGLEWNLPRNHLRDLIGFIPLPIACLQEPPRELLEPAEQEAAVITIEAEVRDAAPPTDPPAPAGAAPGLVVPANDETPGRASNGSRVGVKSAVELAKAHGLDPENLRKRLDRERQRNQDCYVELDDAERKPHDPKFLYRPEKVQHVIAKMKAR